MESAGAAARKDAAALDTCFPETSLSFSLLNILYISVSFVFLTKYENMDNHVEEEKEMEMTQYQ